MVPALEVGARVAALYQTREIKDMKQSCETTGQDRPIMNSTHCESLEQRKNKVVIYSLGQR